MSQETKAVHQTSLASHRKVASFAIIVAVALLTLVQVRPSSAEAASVTIWGDGAPSGFRIAHDDRSVELGTVFTAVVPGEVTGLRFYKTSGASGSHTGTLWDSKGRQLATLGFGRESRAGWQTATFDKPVQLVAGSTYVASYRVPAGGRYGSSVDYYGRSKSSELRVASRGAGVFTYEGRGTYPTSKWNASQYFVDVVFAPRTPKPTPTASSSPSASSSSAAPTVSPSATADSSPKPTPTTSSAPIAGFPTRSTTGVPSGWTPTRQVTGDYVVTQAGQVVEDLRVTNGTLYVRAANVTLRRVEIVSGRIINEYAGRCYNGLNIVDSSILRGSRDHGMPVVESGGYTATRVKIDGPSEGFRIAGGDVGCDPVTIQDSWVKIDTPDGCNSVDYWHGDGVQGYMGVEVTVRNTYINLAETRSCPGTAAFFYPNQFNKRANIENVLLEGGGYVFRLGTPGSVSGLKVVDDSWLYGPVDVADCRSVEWGTGNEIVSVGADGSLRSVARLQCSGW